jgi:hypothetical protein
MAGALLERTSIALRQDAAYDMGSAAGEESDAGEREPNRGEAR